LHHRHQEPLVQGLVALHLASKHIHQLELILGLHPVIFTWFLLSVLVGLLPLALALEVVQAQEVD
jgi:hypothetical protein